MATERLMRAADVARELGVSYNTALGLMKTMPCVNLTPDPKARRRLYGIYESELHRQMQLRSEVPQEQGKKPGKRRAVRMPAGNVVSYEELLKRQIAEHKKNYYAIREAQGE